MVREAHQARLDKIESMRDVILAAGDEAQELKKLPDDIVSKMINEGFFLFS